MQTRVIHLTQEGIERFAVYSARSTRSEHQEQQGIDAVGAAGGRVMVCVDGQAQAQSLLRRGWQMATRNHAELLAVFVETPGWASASPEQKRSLEENLQFAKELGAEAMRVRASDVARLLAQVAQERNVGSIVIGHSGHGRLHALLRGSIVKSLLRMAGDFDVHVVADRNGRSR